MIYFTNVGGELVVDDIVGDIVGEGDVPVMLGAVVGSSVTRDEGWLVGVAAASLVGTIVGCGVDSSVVTGVTCPGVSGLLVGRGVTGVTGVTGVGLCVDPGVSASTNLRRSSLSLPTAFSVSDSMKYGTVDESDPPTILKLGLLFWSFLLLFADDATSRLIGSSVIIDDGGGDDDDIKLEY